MAVDHHFNHVETAGRSGCKDRLFKRTNTCLTELRGGE